MKDGKFCSSISGRAGPASIDVLVPAAGPPSVDPQRLRGTEKPPAFSNDRVGWDGSHIQMKFGQHFFSSFSSSRTIWAFCWAVYFLRFFMLLAYTLNRPIKMSDFWGPLHQSAFPTFLFPAFILKPVVGAVRLDEPDLARDLFFSSSRITAPMLQGWP